MELIAHRGASGYCPENTIPAFKRAVEMGATTIELDVQMTKDGELIVMHDFVLDRTAGGEGLIMDSTMDYISTLDAGIWYDKKFKGTHIPTLKEVLEVIPASIRIDIEIKKLAIDSRHFEEKVFNLVKDMNRLDNVYFSSFDHQLLLRLQSLGADKLAMLIGSNMVEPWNYLEMIGLRCIIIKQSLAFINKDFIQQAHNHQIEIFSYTVNSKAHAQLFEEFEIDGIITNYLDIMDK